MAHRWFCSLSWGSLVLLGLGGCGEHSEAPMDREAESAAEESSALDSRFTPTSKGEVRKNVAETGRLSGMAEGYPVWTFSGNRGDKVRITLESPDFETYLRVSSKTRHIAVKKGTFLHPLDKVYFSVVDLELPESGTFRVLTTSVDNMGFRVVGRSAGTYRIEVESDE